MATNATTWFYAEPETGRPYLIAERLTHTFWANRLSSVSFTCLQAEAPYKAITQWNDVTMTLEWEVKNYLRLTLSREEQGLVAVVAEVLGFRPTLSYNEGPQQVIEWYLDKDAAGHRLSEVQGNPAFSNIRKR